MPYYAHSLEGAPPEDWQHLIDHLLGVAKEAYRRGEKFGGGAATRMAGLLHDLGKYSSDFQRRLAGADIRDQLGL